MATTLASWGDELSHERPVAVPGAELLGRVEEHGPDADGIKTVISYRRNVETGAVEKVTRRIKTVVRTVVVQAGVKERRAWRRFGQAAAGNEGCTSISYEDIHFDLPSVEVKDDLDKLADQGKSMFVCRHCGAVGKHYTLKCPYKDIAIGKGKEAAQAAAARDEASGAGEGGAGGGVYVPPHKQLGAISSTSTSGETPIEELKRIRIGNLDYDVEEGEVRGLCAPFGIVSHVSLSKRDSGLAAAFVTFVRHEDARRAKEGLDGQGFGYMILRVEWAKPSNKDVTSTGIGGAHMSGYGKALPQNRPDFAGPAAGGGGAWR